MAEREGQDPTYGEKTDQEPQYGDGSEGAGSQSAAAEGEPVDTGMPNSDLHGQAKDVAEHASGHGAAETPAGG